MSYYFLYIPLYLFSLLPLWILYGFADLAYLFVNYVFGYRKEVATRNLANSFPEKGEKELKLIRNRFYRIFTDHFAEIGKLASMKPRNLAKRVTFENIEIVKQYFAEGKNVIGCMGHCGNWEMLNILPLVLGRDVFAAYKPLRNKNFDRLMIRLRSRFGITPIPSRSVARNILSRKDNPAFYLFLADQCPEKVNPKYRFEFLGQSTAMYNGAEKLAIATGTAVIYLNVRQTRRGRYLITVIPVSGNPQQTSETEITRTYTRLLEENIRQEPADWLWSHRRWKR